MINVVFFAALREQLNCEKISIAPEAITTVADVKKALCEQYPHWQSALNQQTLLVAINHQMATVEQSVNDNDEIAFFPPVTGG